MFLVYILPALVSNACKMSPVRCHQPESLLAPNADIAGRISISKQENKEK